ncbi:MAG: metallophosphoesterase [Kofleriaceae bacterium]
MLAQLLRTLLSSLISGVIHYYVWRRVVRDPQWPRRARRLATTVLIAMYVAAPLTMIATRLGAATLATALGWVAMPWMVAVGLTAVWLGGLDLLRGGAAIAARLRSARAARPQAATVLAPADVPDPARRIFLARAASGTALAATAASLSAGMMSARGDHEVVTVELELPRLPRALDGFSIVQLTDLHVGITIDREFVQRVVQRANALRPDLIALTGDLVDGKVEELRDEIAPLRELRAPHGVYAVTGNHEYYSGVDPWIAEISRLGVRYLRNERVEIGAGGDGFELAGIDDHSAHKWPGHGADLAAAVRGRDPSRALVLLAHQPRQVREAVKHGVDLQLSGHTHGGQVWPWHYIARAQQEGLLSGLYQRGPTQVYVSRGCGYFGPPIRLAAPLEITRIVLRAR